MKSYVSSPQDGPIIESKNGITTVTVKKLEDLKRLPPGGTDWKALDALSDEEVERRALGDPDAQPMTETELARMRPLPNVKAIRQKLGLTQEQFAVKYMLSVATIRDWEQRRRMPLGPAMGYLYAIAAEPERVAAAVAEDPAPYVTTVHNAEK